MIKIKIVTNILTFIIIKCESIDYVNEKKVFSVFGKEYYLTLNGYVIFQAKPVEFISISLRFYLEGLLHSGLQCDLVQLLINLSESDCELELVEQDSRPAGNRSCPVTFFNRWRASGATGAMPV